MRADSRELAATYLRAKRAVIAAGFEREIAWQEAACEMPVTEARFLAEAAWVVLSSGMRETVVRQVYPAVALAFGEFASARVVIAASQGVGRRRALEAFHHEGKIDAIIQIAKWVAAAGFDEVRERLRTEGPAYLQNLPFIGPVTSLHLAKNLGHDVAKPDRHLTRIAAACGYACVQQFCSVLQAYLGEPVPVVDVVLWRFATLSPDYLDSFDLVSPPRPRAAS